MTSCAETAKAVRKALHAAFPTTTFSVVSKTYSGGSSIRVTWTDGPVTARVKAITDPMEGADFDGMQDLKTYRGNGSGADYISPTRRISREKETTAEALAWLQEYFDPREPPFELARRARCMALEQDRLGFPEPWEAVAEATHYGARWGRQD